MLAFEDGTQTHHKFCTSKSVLFFPQSVPSTGLLCGPRFEGVAGLLKPAADFPAYGIVPELHLSCSSTL